MTDKEYNKANRIYYAVCASLTTKGLRLLEKALGRTDWDWADEIISQHRIPPTLRQQRLA